MNIEHFRDYCLSKKGVTEELPFGPNALVFKLMGKMFALASLDSVPLTVNLKCDPEKALDLRDEYPENVLPGYHMSKKHWNTMVLDGNLQNSLIFELTDHSYELVREGLTKKLREELESL